MTSPSKRDIERRLDDLDADTDGDRREDIDLSLSADEKEAFDVDPDTMKKP